MLALLMFFFLYLVSFFVSGWVGGGWDLFDFGDWAGARELTHAPLQFHQSFHLAIIGKLRTPSKTLSLRKLDCFAPS